MMKYLRLAAIAAAFLAVVVASRPLYAQPGPPPRFDEGFGPGPGGPPPPPPEGGPGFGPGPDGPGGEFFAEVMMARLSKELDLNDEQTVLMVRRFSELRDQVREIRRKRNELARELEDRLHDSKPDTAKTTATLDEIMKLDQQVFENRRGVFEEMGKDLDALKKAKLYLFLDQFESDMRRMIGEAREKFRGGRPGPGGRGPEGRGPEGRGGPDGHGGPGGPDGRGPERRGPEGPGGGRRPEGPPPGDERGWRPDGPPPGEGGWRPDGPPPPPPGDGDEWRPEGPPPQGGPGGPGPRGGERPPKGDRPGRGPHGENGPPPRGGHGPDGGRPDGPPPPPPE